MMNQPAAGPSSDCHHTQMVAPAVSHDDYVDKGVAALTDKAGGNSSKTRAFAERVTDKLRAWFEKITGKKVPAQISN